MTPKDLPIPDPVVASTIMNDWLRVEIPVQTGDDARYLVVGMIDGTHWTVLTRYHVDRMRPMAIRQSRDEEIALYEC